MSTTSKSPRKVALVAVDVGKAALPAYAHRFSPKVFTQPQLFACLVLRQFFRTDYRGITGILSDAPLLRDAIGIQKVPHWTTLQKASRRLLRNASVQKLLDATLVRARPRRRHKRRPRVKRSAIDSSGFESHQCSSYFVRRRAKGRKDWQKTTYKTFPKLAMLANCSNHMVLAAVAERGPGPDITHFERIVCQAYPRAKMETLLADAGYDAEWVHEVARHDLGIRTIIPPKIGRGTDKPPTGYHRRVMSERIHLTCYGQRWQAETTFSMIKRRLGSAVNARSYWSQCRALMLKAVVHNILILHAPTEPSRPAAGGVFYRAFLTPFILLLSSPFILPLFAFHFGLSPGSSQ